MSPARWLTKLAELSVRRPRTVLAVALALSLLGFVHAGLRLELHTSNLDLIDPELPEVRRFLDFAERFGTPNVLVVVFEAADAEAVRAAVDRAGPQLRRVEGLRTLVDRLPVDEDALEFLGVEPYLLSEDGRMAFALAQPDDERSQADTIAPFVLGVRRALDESGLDELGVHAGLTGIPAYALDDRETIEHDIARLSLVSLVLIFLLFAFAFGSPWRPLLAVATLLVTLGVVLGVAAAWPGHLTLLSAFFASILFGLGIDFAIHLLGHVEELVAAGRSETEAVPRAVAHLAPGLATGALTTAAIFFSMLACGFRGFAELGAIAGAGLLLCLIATVTVLPALLVLVHPKPGRERRAHERFTGRLLHALQHRWLAVAVVALAVVGGVVGGPGFDGDYLNLQPRGSETVRLEREMVERSELSPNFAAFVVADREAAAALGERLLLNPLVGEVSSIADLEALAGPDELQLDEAYLRSFEAADGRNAVYAHPRGDIWAPEPQAEFLAAMREIDPSVTGMPFLGSFMVERSRRALNVTAAIGSLLLVACLLIDFRRPLPALVAALPCLLAVVSLHALMRLFDLPFNPLNVMALPVVIGIAVDDGVHVVHRYLAERGDLLHVLSGTGRSVVLTSLTTIAAFGSLAFTAHRGLASFALALCLGVGSALVITVLVLPPLLTALGPTLLRRGGRSPS